MSNKRLMKSNERVLCGVCGGIGEYLDVDPVAIRVAYVLLSLCCAGFPGLLAYIVLAIVMPSKS